MIIQIAMYSLFRINSHNSIYSLIPNYSVMLIPHWLNHMLTSGILVIASHHIFFFILQFLTHVDADFVAQQNVRLGGCMLSVCSTSGWIGLPLSGLMRLVSREAFICNGMSRICLMIVVFNKKADI